MPVWTWDGTDGKSVIVNNLSVGNSVIDSLFGAQFKQSFQDGLQSSLTEDLAQSGMPLIN